MSQKRQSQIPITNLINGKFKNLFFQKKGRQKFRFIIKELRVKNLEKLPKLFLLKFNKEITNLVLRLTGFHDTDRSTWKQNFVFEKYEVLLFYCKLN